MAHFAQIDETNTVINVIVINNDSVNNLPYPESEPIGQTFIASLGFTGRWLETSYNANFRVYYAGIGYYYDETLDEFIPPPPIEPVEPA